MTKKKIKKEEKKEEITQVPKKIEEKFKKIKEKLDKFKNAVLKKFDTYIMGISLLPPEKGNEDKEINLLVLVDDTDSQKMSKYELKEKLSKIIETTAKEIDEKIKPTTIIQSELWGSLFDSKYELVKSIAASAPIFDRGMLGAVKIIEIHKSMVLKKFEKYIVGYILVGSIPQGKASPESDIDVWIIIDDTDVKKMTRAELKDKLRAIITGMGIEAGEITGIKNKLSAQVHILTDVWDSIKEANPVVFTFLRDGVPFFDRGTFMPWKQLLRMGKIKPSKEAIDLFMSSGDQILKRIKFKMKEMGMEDIYYAILTPSQAALMLYGLPPPTPKETPQVLREIFVQKEGILEDKFVKILETNIKIRKDLEHGDKKELTGKEVDKLLDDAKKYLERIEKLFKQIEEKKNQESMKYLYDHVVTIIRDILKTEGIKKAQEAELVKLFEDEMIASGKVPAKYLRDLNEIIKAKTHYDKGKLTKSEIEKARKGSKNLIKFLVEYLQRKRGAELEKTKIRVKHGEKYGEVILLEDEAYIIHDIDAEHKQISTSKIKTDGDLGIIKDSSLDELEKALMNAKFPKKVFIKEKTFEKLKDIFGADVQILISS